MLIGVDPGANYTGVVIWDNDHGFTFHREYREPERAWDIIVKHHAIHGDRLEVIVEDFLGGGHLNNDKRRTIEVLGLVYWGCKHAGIRVHRPPQQRRLCNVDNVPDYITGKDEIAAAAHVLSHLELAA